MATSWLSDDELETWKSFLAASQRIEAIVDEELRADIGITHSGWEILVRLSEEPSGALRMGELARAVFIGKSALTYKIGLLERQGLVRRTRCPADARGLQAEITPQGRTLLQQGASSHVAIVRKLLIDAITPDELRALHHISRKLDHVATAFSPTPPCPSEDVSSSSQQGVHPQ
jgi:DNA-binding MarR family transcriptional regulator